MTTAENLDEQTNDLNRIPITKRIGVKVIYPKFTKVWTILVSWALHFKGIYIFPKVSQTQGNRRKITRSVGKLGL